jgi:hypothetical protein
MWADRFCEAAVNGFATVFVDMPLNEFISITVES